MEFQPFPFTLGTKPRGVGGGVDDAWRMLKCSISKWIVSRVYGKIYLETLHSLQKPDQLAVGLNEHMRRLLKIITWYMIPINSWLKSMRDCVNLYEEDPETSDPRLKKIMLGLRQQLGRWEHVRKIEMRQVFLGN